jgi:large-conductance mechanosensitive channel
MFKGAGARLPRAPSDHCKVSRFRVSRPSPPPHDDKPPAKAARQMMGESLARDEKLVAGSPRGFGLVMAAFFAILTAIALWRASGWFWPGLFAAVAGLFGLAALTAPRLLGPLNQLWFRFGLLLHAIINPLVMGMMFFLVITPIGLLMRAFGKRPIPLSPDPEAASYWIARDQQPGPMTQQY